MSQTQPKAQRTAQWLTTTLLISLLALSWSGIADRSVVTATTDKFQRALTIAALARAFNGVVSVAQDTEVAIQPVGVGVTLGVGQILDPLNDLIERFSGLALVATVSLGLQISLAELLSTDAVNWVLTAIVVLTLCFTWLPKPAFAAWHRALVAMLAIRFIMLVVLGLGHWVDVVFLQQQQEVAMSQLRQATEDIEALRHQTPPTPEHEQESFYDRTAESLSNLLNTTKQTLDLEAQFAALQQRVEASITELIRLAVIFVLQTLVIPLATLAGGWYALRFILRRLLLQQAAGLSP